MTSNICGNDMPPSLTAPANVVAFPTSRDVGYKYLVRKADFSGIPVLALRQLQSSQIKCILTFAVFMQNRRRNYI